jgi:hypothetical protein
VSDVATVAFFGDAEHRFALTPWAQAELEKLTGVGMGALCLRLPHGDFRIVEIVETIRLALIGGGMPPQDAARLVDSYAKPRPLGETFPLAARILYRLWNGKDPEPEAEGQDDDPAVTGDLAAAINAAYADVADD